MDHWTKDPVKLSQVTVSATSRRRNHDETRGATPEICIAIGCDRMQWVHRPDLGDLWKSISTFHSEIFYWYNEVPTGQLDYTSLCLWFQKWILSYSHVIYFQKTYAFGDQYRNVESKLNKPYYSRHHFYCWCIMAKACGNSSNNSSSNNSNNNSNNNMNMEIPRLIVGERYDQIPNGRCHLACEACGCKRGPSLPTSLRKKEQPLTFWWVDK